jgi:hypothetical protein
MPNQNLSDEEIDQYLRYFQWVDEQQSAAQPHDGRRDRKESAPPGKG